MQPYSYFTDFLFTDKKALEYVTDKKKSVNAILKEMVNRLQMMFEYKNLPDTIPSNQLETMLLVNGQCIIAKPKGAKIPKCYNKDSLYAFMGSPGGEPDPYYRPTKYLVSNPALQYTNEFTIFPSNQLDIDAVLMRNDTLWEGMYPLMSRYATLIAENLLTLRTADIMLRITALITAPNDKDKMAADIFLKKLFNGEMAAIAENRFLDGIKMQSPPSNNGSYMTQFIELHQYLTGRFYNDIGLNSNYNMKREALSEGETGLNEDSLPTLSDNMLRCRKEDIEKVNELFGTDISVEFNCSWKENIKEHDLKLEQMKNDAQSSNVFMGSSNQLDETSNQSDNESNQLDNDRGDGDEQSINMDSTESTSTDSQSDRSDEKHTGDSERTSDGVEGASGEDIGRDGLQPENNESGDSSNGTIISITNIAASDVQSVTTNTDDFNDSNSDGSNDTESINDSNTDGSNDNDDK